MDKGIVYAPIMIVTCNRYDHLKRCVESLKKNSYAIFSELYISVDYPPGEKYIDGWEKIRTWLNVPIKGFKSVYVFFQEKNLGPSGNVIFLRNIIFEKYDRVISTEDDNEFSANFLEYMDKGLEIYKDDPRVFGICGYSPECDFRKENSDIIALTDFNMWGVGLWKSKEKIIREQLTLSKWIEASKDLRKMFFLYRSRKRLFSRMLGILLNSRQEEILRSTDINRGIFLALNDCFTIHPSISKVRNWGWDGSGENIKGSDNKYMEYAKQLLDNSSEFRFPAAVKEPMIYNNRLLDDNSEWNKERARWYNDPLAYILYRILGREKYFKFIFKEDI